MPELLFVILILLTCILSAILSIYAYKRKEKNEAHWFPAIFLSVFFLALVEIISILSYQQSQALFWYKFRYFFIGVLPVFWLLFSFEYCDYKYFLSNRLKTGLFFIPIVTQLLLWTNHLHRYWVSQEVSFIPAGQFMLVDVSTLIPSFWFAVHSFYSLFLLISGIILIIYKISKQNPRYWGQSIFVVSSAILPLIISITQIFRLYPDKTLDFFTPSLGLGELLIAIAVIKFQFLKTNPLSITEKPRITTNEPTNRSLVQFYLIYGIMSICLVSIGYVHYRNIENQFQAQVKNKLNSIATLKMHEVTNWRDDKLDDANLFYDNQAFSELVENYFENSQDQNSANELNIWFRHFLIQREYNQVFLLDTQSKIRMAVPNSTEDLPTHLVQDTATVINTKEITFLDFHRDSSNEKINLALIIPIMKSQNPDIPIAVLVLRIDPQVYFYPHLQEYPEENTSAETLIVRRDGNDVLFLNNLKFYNNSALNLRFRLNDSEILAVKAILGQNGVVEGLDYLGNQVIGCVIPVNNSPWFLVTKMNRDEAYAPFQERIWQVVIMFAVLIISSGLMMGLVWHQQRLKYFQEQAKAAETIRESEIFITAILDNLPIGIAVNEVNPVVRFNYMNDNFLKIYRTSREALVDPDKFWEQVYENPEFRENIKQIILDDCASGDPSRMQWDNIPIVRKGEKTSFISAKNIPVPDKPWMISTVWDITEQKEAEMKILANQIELQRLLSETEQSRQALLSLSEDQKAAQDEISKLNNELEQRVRERTDQLVTINAELESFTYSVSHDLRAPLRGIDGWSQILLEEYQDKLDEEGRESLHYIRSETQRMGQLIDDLLKLSRVTRAEMFLEEVSLSNLVEIIINRERSNGKDRKINILVQPNIMAMGDKNLLDIMLTNLISNAWKFTSKNPEVIIEFNKITKDGEDVFFVRDNGAGFDMSYEHKLFGVFQRLHKASEFPGTGIGLATVKRIVRRHGGEIWAESEIGKGATFYFTLKEA